MYKIVVVSLCLTISAAHQDRCFFMKTSNGVSKIDDTGYILARYNDGLISEDKKHVVYFDNWNKSCIIEKSDSTIQTVPQRDFCLKGNLVSALLAGMGAISSINSEGSWLFSLHQQKSHYLKDIVIDKMGIVCPVPMVPHYTLLAGILNSIHEDQGRSSLGIIDINTGKFKEQYTYPSHIRFFSTHNDSIVAIDRNGYLHKGSFSPVGYQHQKSINISQLVSVYTTSKNGWTVTHMNQSDIGLFHPTGLTMKVGADGTHESSGHAVPFDISLKLFFSRIADIYLASENQLFVTCIDTDMVEKITV